MDIIQEFTPQLLSLYQTIIPYLLPLQRLSYQIYDELASLAPDYLNKAALLAQESPAVLSLGVLFLFLLMAVQILGWIRRLMLWWFRLCVRVAFWGVVVVLVSVVWQRGLGRTVGDLMEWGEKLRVVWWREYRRWEGYQNLSHEQMRGGAGSRAQWR